MNSSCHLSILIDNWLLAIILFSWCATLSSDSARITHSSVSPTFFHWGTPKAIVHFPRNPCPWKRIYIYMCIHIHTYVCVYIYIYVYKETVLSALKLLQYFQLPNKNSRDISRYIYNYLWCFKIIMYLFLFFLLELLTVFCGTLSFRGT
jgi:hypothetical protein